LRDLQKKYESAVNSEACALLHPNQRDRQLLGDELLKRRANVVREAQDANRLYIEAVINDLSESFVHTLPLRPLAEYSIITADMQMLPSSSYGTIATVLLHLLRDWSTTGEQVVASTYAPIVAELQKSVPQGCSVLLPGAGLGRLAMEVAREDYCVEANDASRLFLTFADYVLNRSPLSGSLIFPMAHVFTENWNHEQQYMNVRVPTPTPGKSDRKITMVPGDFIASYRPGGLCHKLFDAIVTCFFIDTVTDFAELVGVMDSFLDNGGVWVNLGPLNWSHDARLKLCSDEIITIFKQLGYEFITEERVDCDYSMPRGVKMYTESYQCSLTTAVKRGRRRLEGSERNPTADKREKDDDGGRRFEGSETNPTTDRREKDNDGGSRLEGAG